MFSINFVWKFFSAAISKYSPCFEILEIESFPFINTAIAPYKLVLPSVTHLSPSSFGTSPLFSKLAIDIASEKPPEINMFSISLRVVPTFSKSISIPVLI